MTTTPVLSIVIPTCDRKDLLANCLDCLAPDTQDLDSSIYEIIVTDDSKTESSKVLIETKYPWAHWTKGPRRGPAANRNHGSHLAKGSWLVFVDDDCLPQPGWLDSIYMHAKSGKLDVLEGETTIPDKTDSPFKYGVENHNGGFFWSCNLAINRETFVKLGEFDEDFLEPGGEDMELAWRINKAGLETKFLQSMLVYHPVREITFRGLLWRTFLHRWRLLYAQKTGQSPPLSANTFRVLFYTVYTETAFLIRTTWSQARNLDPKMCKTQLFQLVWSWLTFPILLPYQIFWEIKFRQETRQ